MVFRIASEGPFTSKEEHRLVFPVLLCYSDLQQSSSVVDLQIVWHSLFFTYIGHELSETQRSAL